MEFFITLGIGLFIQALFIAFMLILWLSCRDLKSEVKKGNVVNSFLMSFLIIIAFFLIISLCYEQGEKSQRSDKWMEYQKQLEETKKDGK